MLDLGFTCLCVYEDQCVIDAEQPALMQGIWRLSAFSQIPSTDIWAFTSALERSQEFLEAVGSGSEASEGFLTGLMRLLGSFLDAPGRFGTSGSAPGGFQDAQGRPGKAQTLRL